MSHFRIVTGTDEHAKIEWSTDVNGNVHTTGLKKQKFSFTRHISFGHATSEKKTTRKEERENGKKIGSDERDATLIYSNNPSRTSFAW